MRVLDPGVSPRRRVYNPTVRRRRCRLRSSSLAASFTSRPCSHARTHIHIEREKDEALPPTLLLLPSSADTAAKELVPPGLSRLFSRTAGGYTPIEREVARPVIYTITPIFFFRRFLAYRLSTSFTPARRPLLPLAPLLPP